MQPEVMAVNAEVSYGLRVRALAELEGLSLSALASAVGFSQPRFSKMINGYIPLDERLLQELCFRYGLPRSFFEVADLTQDSASVTFRKKATTSSTADKRIIRLYSEAARLWRQASLRSGYKTFSLPKLNAREHTPFDAALLVRERMGLQEEEPINNVTRLLERSGVGVLDTLDPQGFAETAHSGISRPSQFESRPLIACVHLMPGAVQRMTLAHELGHLIFDQDLSRQPASRGPEERRAFMFAGALLLPEGMMRREVNESLTLNAYLRIKGSYGVSVMAIIKHARNLDLISRERERSLYIQANSRGWRTNEPVAVPRETAALLPQAVARAWSGGIGEVSVFTGVKKSLIEHWLGIKTTAEEKLAPVVTLPTLASKSSTAVMG